MVVVCRTHRLFISTKCANPFRTIQLMSSRSVFSGSYFFNKNNVREKYNNGLRLCQCRSFHSSREPRNPSTLAKLSPQEILASSSVWGFYYPDCEYAGMSCLDCYTQKQCLDFFGLIHWSDTPCGTSVSGTANVYCDPNSNKCSSSKPDGCAAISKYTCTRNGDLPDFGDCTQYHKCTNMSAEDFKCDDNYIYKQEYGKCIFKLSSNDCVTVASCGLENYIALYPGDSSIYYGCTNSALFVKACTETQSYDIATQSCVSICNSNGLLANTRNCSQYYSCDAAGSVPVIQECPENEGYDPYRQICAPNYKNLCNELVLLESDFYGLLSSNPVVALFIEPIKAILGIFNLSPVNVIFYFGFPEQWISNGIIIGDYVFKYQQIPPTTLGIVIDLILDYLPPEIRTVIETLMNLGIINVRSESIRDVKSTDEAVKAYLETVLVKARIDVPGTLMAIHGKTQTEISSIIFREILSIFNVPESQIPFLAMLLRSNMPVVANSLNHQVGQELFVVVNNALKLNENTIDNLVYSFVSDFAGKMYPNNIFLAEFFKLSAKHQYALHHGEVDKFVEDFYFSADNLV